MSADLLRRAAAVLRQHAEKATPGPWVVTHEDMYFEVRSTAKFQYGWQSRIVDIHSPDDTWPDFDYIALLGPPVALALADLLHVLSWFPSQADATDLQVAEILAKAILREPEAGDER